MESKQEPDLRALDAEVAEKHCKGCDSTLPVSLFGKCSRAPDGLSWRCRPCARKPAIRYATSPRGRARKREWHSRNRDKVAAQRKARRGFYDPAKMREYRRRRSLRMAYGMTLEQYNDMLVAQNGVCAICGNTQTQAIRGLNVDHCHETGEIRALLCDNCNVGIAHFKESPDLLDRAKAYLLHHRKDEERRVA